MMKNKKEMRQKTLDEKKRDLRNSLIMEIIFISVFLSYFLLLYFSFYEHPVSMVRKGQEFSVALTDMTNALTKFQIFRFMKQGCFPSKMFGGIITVVMLVDMLAFMYYSYNKFRLHHDENTLKGSAQWANIKALCMKYADFVDRKKRDFVHAKNNVIFSKNFYASTNVKKHKHALNTLIVGASGTGKTRFWLKPNLLQMNTSYVITDPKGEILENCGEALRRNGYDVKVFDIKDMKDCCTYNPLKYCKKENDIKKVVEAFILNTDKTGGKGGGNRDPFWDDAMNGFMCATIALLTTCPKGSDIPYGQIPEVTGGTIYEPCFSNLTEFTRMANSKWTDNCGIARLGDAALGDGKNNTANASKLAMIFSNLAVYEAKLQNKPVDMIEKPYALREWENFKIAPEKTSTTILMTVAVRLDPFNIAEIRDLTTTDTVCLDEFATKKTALFLIMDATDKTYNFLLAFLFTQLFNILYNFGEYKVAGSKSLRMKDGEFVYFFPKEIAQDNNQVKDIVADLKKAKPVHQEKPGNTPVTKTDGKYHHTFSDEWWDIVSPNGILISRKPSKAEAEEYCENLKHASLKSGQTPALPIPVRMLIDEFPNIGKIPEYMQKLATMRGYDISSVTICQTITQLKGMYPDDYEVIDGNSPFVVFLGGDENSNNDYLSKKLGMSTVRNNNSSVDSKKVSASYNIDGRELMRPEELGRLPYEECLVFIYGEQPVRDLKCDVRDHKNYKQTEDYAKDMGVDDKYLFDRSIFHVEHAAQPYRKAVVASYMPRTTSFTPEKFAQIFGTATPEDALAKFKKYNTPAENVEKSQPKAF